MEHVFAVNALRAILPKGVCTIRMQPPTTKEPPDHEARCAARRVLPTATRRADIAIDFRNLRTINIDVSATNTVSNTALRSSSAISHLESVENTKDRTYKWYYNEFEPFVLSLAGGVTERSWGVSKKVSCIAAT